MIIRILKRFYLLKLEKQLKSPLSAAVGTPTHSGSHSATHTLGQSSRLPTLLFYFGRIDKKAGQCPNMVNGTAERSGGAANQRRDADVVRGDARTGFH